MSRKLFVGGLSWNTTDEGLRAAFGRFGTVIEAKVVTDRETGRSRGFGFVGFQNPADSEAARQAMDGATLDQRQIRVNIAEDKPRGPRPDARGAEGGGPGPRPFSADRPREPVGDRGGFTPRPAATGERPGRSFEPRPGGFDRGGPPPSRGFGGPPPGPPAPPPVEGRSRRDRDRDRDRGRDDEDRAAKRRGRGRRRHEEGDGDLDMDY